MLTLPVMQVDGGYYADPEAECQAFHVCARYSTQYIARYYPPHLQEFIYVKYLKREKEGGND